MKKLKNQKTPCSILYLIILNLFHITRCPSFSLISADRYILDKLSVQAGLETQSVLTGKLEEANNRIKSLENELQELKTKPDVGEEQPPEEVPPVEDTTEAEPTEEDVEQ